MGAPNLSYPRPTAPYPPPYTQNAPRRMNPWALRLTLLFFSGLVLLVLVLMILIAGYEFLHQGEIYPGVSTVFDVDLTGMTREEAASALSKRFSYPQDATFAFRYGNQTWQFTAGDLGVQLDAAATVDSAYQAGREGNRIEALLDQIDIWLNGYPVTPVITYNQSEAEYLLTEIANTYINRPMVDAALTIRDHKAYAPPSQVGRSVDIPATLSALRQEIVALNTHSEITLIVNETAPVVLDTTQAAEQINLALSAPVTFFIDLNDHIDQGPWVSQIESLEQMLVVEPVQNDDGTGSYTVSLSLDQARDFLDQLAPDLTIQPVNARFTFNDDTRQLDVIENSVNGRGLDVESTIARFEKAVFTSNAAERRVALVFQDIPAAIPDTATAAQLGITELVIKKTTFFYGSTAARRNNIVVAASRFHGLVVAPNATFSFNEWLGDVSAETGYEQGLIIVGNQTITGVGGGVCQVATTAFQTAFYGGYPILERVEHAYRVGYYEEGEGPGMDATVYSPIVDFRFQNDTPYYLLIETYVDLNNATVTWKFYSTGMNRRVEKDGPYVRNVTSAPPASYHANAALSPGQIRQIDYAVSGADVYVYRTVYQDDRVIIDHEEYHSHYVPWADQYEVAPGDSRIN